MRGFFSGIVWGVVLCILGVATLSVLAPLAPAPELVPDAPEPAVAQADATGQVPVEAPGGDSDVVEQVPASTAGQNPEPGSIANLSDADTAPSEKPEAPLLDSGLPDPAAPAETPDVTVPGNDDTTPGANTAVAIPSTPQPESPAEIRTEMPNRPAVSDSQDPISVAEDDPTGSPAVSVAPDEVPAVTTPGRVAGEPKIDDAPDPATEPAPEIDVVAPNETEDEPEASEEPRRPAQIAVLPQAGQDSQGLRPTIGKRVVPLTDRNKQPVIAASEPAIVPTDLPPLQRYAAAFDNADNKPLLSIILIDDEAAIGVEALREFPYPLSFAIDPTAPDAAEKMARHRAAGFEVVALVDLPRMATAQDAEVSLAAGFDTLSEAVGILEGTGTGIQGNRSLSGQVADFARSTGRGLVTQDSGLNTAHKLALRDGAAAAVVFRDFDGAGQDPTVMRRFLDQAAFRASQDGGVIMLGRVRPDTISALLLWGLQDRASRVALAPVSAVLQRSRD